MSRTETASRAKLDEDNRTLGVVKHLQADQAPQTARAENPPLFYYHQELVALQEWAREQLESGATPAYVLAEAVTEKLGYNCDLNEFIQRRFWY